MGLLLLWGCTIILSMYMEAVTAFKILKDIADVGYKVNIDNMSDFSNQFNSNNQNLGSIKYLIPIYNVIKAMELATAYNNNNDLIIEQMANLDLIEEMSDLEKEEYAKKPTGLNAILVSAKAKARLENAIILNIDSEEDGKGKIYFDFDKENNITILKVEGTLTSLPLEKQKALVDKYFFDNISDAMEKIAKLLEDYSKDSVDLDDSIKLDGNTLDIYISKPTDEVKDEKVNGDESKETTISKQKQELEGLRDKLLEYKEALKDIKDNQDSQDNQSEEGPKLTKKRK